MARRSKNAAIGGDVPREREVRGARLEPIRVVERELTLPDGTTCRVKVPVYPPFRLEEPKVRAARAARENAQKKSA
jgi:hypothetical protein